jgi:hypothetical protein
MLQAMQGVTWLDTAYQSSLTRMIVIASFIPSPNRVTLGPPNHVNLH